MDRSNLLRAVYFDTPDYIPVIFHVNLACWDHYPRDALAELVRTHPQLFPKGVPPYIEHGEPVPYPPWCRKDSPWVDPWGCRWETSMSGYIGSVTRHPLAAWDALASFVAPDPGKTTHWHPVDWDNEETLRGGSIGFFDCLRSGEVGHGHTFLKLIDLLGYERAIYALSDDDPRMHTVLRMLEEFNHGLVRHFLDDARVEWLGYAEDLGMQQGPLLSPALFRKHIAPSYRRIMEPARERGAVVHMHSDGDIKALADDLLELPIRVLNIQDRVNGLPWIAETFKGRVAIDLDIDRQHITPSAAPAQVQDYVAEILRQLSDPAGGLILTFGLYPGTPLPNVSALMDILEEVAQGSDTPGRACHVTL